MAWQITSMATDVKQSARQIIEETHVAIRPSRGLFHTSQRLFEKKSLSSTCLKVCCAKIMSLFYKRCRGFCALHTKILLILQAKIILFSNCLWLNLISDEIPMLLNYKITKPLSPYLCFNQLTAKFWRLFPSRPSEGQQAARCFLFEQRRSSSFVHVD